jgi:hypothetical protein
LPSGDHAAGTLTESPIRTAGAALDEIRQSVLYADVVDRDDIGMVQRSDAPRFLLEAAPVALSADFGG